MDKESFLKGILERKKSTMSKMEEFAKIKYLKTVDDKEYKKLKRELKTQIILDDADDLEYLTNKIINTHENI